MFDKEENKEFTSYECAKEVNDILGRKYHLLCRKQLEKCWRYPTSSNGGHPRGPYIDDFYWDDDPFNEYDDTVCAFTWHELYELMNKLPLSDYEKATLEEIGDIDQFAMELHNKIEERKEK